jgi:hypothetical protein
MRVTSPTISKTFPVGRGALEFYGVGDRVELPDLRLSWKEGPDEPTPYSVELWFKPTLARDQLVLYAPAGEADQEPAFVFKVTGAGAVHAGHAKDHLLKVDGAFQVGVWQHLAFVFGGLQTAHLYVNGTLKGSSRNPNMPKSGPWKHGVRLSCPIRQNPPINESIEGQIAMLRIWRIDRLEPQIRESMYLNVTGPDRQWLVTEWPLNEGFGEFLFDRSRRLDRSRQRNLYEEPGAGKLVEGEMKRKPEWVAAAMPRRSLLSAAYTVEPQAVYSLAPLMHEKDEKDRATSTGMFLTEFEDHPEKNQPGDVFSLHGTSFTVEFWFKQYGDLKAGLKYILFSHWPWRAPNEPDEVLRIGLDGATSGDKLFMSFPNSTVTIQYKPDGQWHHCACVYDHDKRTRTRQIFFDGSEVGKDDVRDGYTVTEAKAFLLWTAGYDKGYLAAPCTLSEIRVWKEARSAEQIKANRLRRLDGTEPKLLLYCPLDRQDELADGTRVVRARVRYPADPDIKPPEPRRFPTEGFERRRLSWLDDGPPIPPRSKL